jgi:hypothetical protein
MTTITDGRLIRLAGKRPIDKGWPQGVFDTPDRFADLLDGWTGNVGMVCGRGLFVLDIDRYKPGCTWPDLEGRLPETLTAETGSGGLHLVFRTDRQIPTRPMPGQVGIDVRGDGGQIVVAPSVHPDTGRAYRWLNDIEPANAPGWLEDLIAGPVNGAAGRTPVTVGGPNGSSADADVVFWLF